MSFPRPFYRWRPHPWHGLSAGEDPPLRVNAFIEITPFDVVKYEVDKETGYLKVDRPQRGSSSPPVLYGFIPRTYCADHVAALSEGVDRADGDPLDICVVSERPINRIEILTRARVVGGVQMIDGGEADDKIVAILDNDPAWSDVDDITGLPPMLIGRIEHYFASYKTLPGEDDSVDIRWTYGADHAAKVVTAAMADYDEAFGES